MVASRIDTASCLSAAAIRWPSGLYANPQTSTGACKVSSSFPGVASQIGHAIEPDQGQPGAVGAERQAGSRFPARRRFRVVDRQCQELPAAVRVPEHHIAVVEARRGQPPAVRGEGQGVGPAGGPGEGDDFPARDQVPDLDQTRGCGACRPAWQRRRAGGRRG